MGLANAQRPVGPIFELLPRVTGRLRASHEARSVVWYKRFFKLSSLAWSMLDNERLQLVGPAGVIGAVVCAEFGAHALAYWPSSPLLWYLSLEVFRPVQYSFSAVNGPVLSDLAQTLCVAVPLLALVCIGLITKVKFLLALASNISLIYSVLLLYGSCLANGPTTKMGVKLSALWDPSIFLLGSVLLAAVLSSAISHRAYWREIAS